jgi:glycosyltransferase involved in cell wall biosynthesis
MKIAFVSTLAAHQWGGSELLWSEAASHLAQQGEAVYANICGGTERVAGVAMLAQAGVKINERRIRLGPDHLRPVVRTMAIALGPVIRHTSRYAFARWLARVRPELICVSNAWIGDDQHLLKLCLKSGTPYAIIVQSNSEHMWPDDVEAQKLAEIYGKAQRVYFVSEANRRLLERQLAVELTNAEIVRNPFHVRWSARPSWPADDGVLRLACVGRLEAEAKGQDLLFQVLAQKHWQSRPITLSFFGSGCNEQSLRRLTEKLGLRDQVTFCGYEQNVERIWEKHHMLVLPSRFEGLPIVIVEAMLCGRAAIVTDVAGNAEVVEDGVTGFVAEAPTVRHLDAAMERAWENRQSLQGMGALAGKKIRELVPKHPAAEFARRLLALTVPAEGPAKIESPLPPRLFDLPMGETNANS